MSEPIKIHVDQRATYLETLAQSYEQLGYGVRRLPQCRRIEVFAKGETVPKSEELQIIERWID